jgi:hypothetical protein
MSDQTNPDRPPSRPRRGPGFYTGSDIMKSSLQYDADEVEFMKAVDTYKRLQGRKFPTLTELLGIVKKLGYRKQA